MQVVLTGRCNVNNRFIERSEVCRRAGNVGITVQATISRSIECLVASRADTTKARRAEQMGIAVISYPDLFRMITEREAGTETEAMESMRREDARQRDGVAGRVRPITGPNGGRMASRDEVMARATGSRHMTGAERRAEARKERRAAARKAKADFYIKEKEPTVPRPHRMLDL